MPAEVQVLRDLILYANHLAKIPSGNALIACVGLDHDRCQWCRHIPFGRLALASELRTKFGGQLPNMVPDKNVDGHFQSYLQLEKLDKLAPLPTEFQSLYQRCL